MLMYPVVMCSADSDEVFDRVLAALRASEDMVRVDRSEAFDLGDEALCSTSSITIDDLITDVFRYAECFTFACRASELIAES